MGSTAMSAYEFMSLYIGSVLATAFITYLICNRPSRRKRLDPSVEAMIEALPGPDETISNKALRRWTSSFQAVMRVIHVDD